MNVTWTNRITYIATGLIGLVLIGIQLPIFNNHGSDRTAAEAQTFPQSLLDKLNSTGEPIKQEPTPTTSNSSSPKLLKFNLSLSNPKDLKVKQGDTVTVGGVLADRVEERSRLTGQRRALDLSLKQIESRKIPDPPPPVPVPTAKSLPPISYAEEEATIRAAATSIEQAERAFQLQQENLKTEPLEESSAVTKAAVELQNRQRLLNNQKRKIDAVAMLKDLPPEVAEHETEVLKQKQAELKQATAEYQQAQAKLSAASKNQTEKLHQLAASLEKARADYQVAIAKLQSKKDQRAYAEYEASVTAARRTEERNQATQSYYRQMQEAEQLRRDRDFQVAQLQARIAEVDDKLSSVSVVTSPYSGVIRRIKFEGQTNNDLSVELTLFVGGTGSASSSPGDSTRTSVPGQLTTSSSSTIP